MKINDFQGNLTAISAEKEAMMTNGFCTADTVGSSQVNLRY